MSHDTPPAPPLRQPWQVPAVKRLHAGGAENRLEGMGNDSQFALGS